MTTALAGGAPPLSAPRPGLSWSLRLAALLLAVVPFTGLAVLSDMRTGHAFVAGELLDKAVPASRTVAKGASWLPGVGWAIKGGLLAWSLYDLYREWRDFSDPRAPGETEGTVTQEGEATATAPQVFSFAYQNRLDANGVAHWGFRNDSANTAPYLLVRRECIDSTGKVSSVADAGFLDVPPGGVRDVTGGCGTGQKPHVVKGRYQSSSALFSTTTVGPWLRWDRGYVDPNQSVQPFAYCRDSTGAVTKVIGSEITYQLGGAQPVIPSVTCPAGATIVGRGLDGGAVGKAKETWVEVLPDGNVSPAPLELVIDGVPCTAGDPRCTQTNIDSLYRTQPDRLLCRWGGMTVPLADCGFLAEPGVEIYNPPVTQPNSSPAPAPSSSGFPTAGVSPRPNDGTNCMDGIWSWNPVHWVYVPVKCALQWAFVPSRTPLAEAQAVGGQIMTRAPFSYAAGVAGWAGSFAGSGSECFTLSVDALGSSRTAVSTCSPGPFVQLLQANRGLLEAAVWSMFLVPLGWWAWRTYAPGSTGVA